MSSPRYLVAVALAALAMVSEIIPASGFGGDVYSVGTFPSGGGFLTCYAPAQNGLNPAAPIGFFAGSNTTLAAPGGVTASAKTGRFYVADSATRAVDEWSLPCPSGRQHRAPANQFTSVQLDSPVGIAVDVSRSTIYVANSATNTIALFNINAHGMTPATCVLGGPATELSSPQRIAVEPNVPGAPHPGYLYVANAGDASVTIYPPNPCGDVGPAGIIGGSKTHMKSPSGVDTYFDGTSMIVYVADAGAHAVLEYHDVLAPGNRAPLRVLGGPPSMLSCPDDVRVAATNFDVYVIDMCAKQIDVFRHQATFDQAPAAWYRAVNPGNFVDNAVGIWLQDRE